MNNVLEDYKKRYPGLTEVYEVVQTVEVVVDDRVCQIEILKCCSNSSIHYTVRRWDLEHAYIQPSYPRHVGAKGLEFEKEPEDMIIRVRRKLPKVHMPNPELALHEALNFLATFR